MIIISRTADTEHKKFWHTEQKFEDQQFPKEGEIYSQDEPEKGRMPGDDGGGVGGDAAAWW
jgi:hypothetical protein